MSRHFGRRSFLALATMAVMGWRQVGTAVAAAEATPTAVTGADWTETLHDDFSDNARFARDWLKITNAGDLTKTMRLPQNDVLGSDGLKLELGDNPADPGGKHPFTGGYVESASFRQRYGYFECEMRIAAEAGVDNAFWLVSDPKTQDERHFELDVVEAKYPNAVQATVRLWRPTRNVLSKTIHPPLKLADGFHRYGMKWGPERFEFSFDDIAFFAAPNDFAHTPALLRFSNAVAAFAGDDDGDVKGAATSIRRVRVFQNADWQKGA